MRVSTFVFPFSLLYNIYVAHIDCERNLHETIGKFEGY